LALAYMHLNISLTDPLLVKFWNTPNAKRHGAFISFVGRHVISRESPKVWLAENDNVKMERLEQLWNDLLKNDNIEASAFKEFGFWMQTKDSLFADTKKLAERIDKTLERSNGDIDWEIGLTDSLPALVEVAPHATLSILRRHLAEGTIIKRARGYIHVDDRLKNVFKMLYSNPDKEIKDGTYALINELLPLGNGMFWDLRKIIEEN